MTALFPTFVYRAEVQGAARFNVQLEEAAVALAGKDKAGHRWCARHGYPGYTSYGSIDNLADHVATFARLARLIDRHAGLFAKVLHWDLRGGKPQCDSMWVNVLAEGGAHTSHIHANAVLSGAYYVRVPAGAGPIVFEDPRHAMMMAAPRRKANAPRELQATISEMPKEGTLLLWESWLRHEVPLNRAHGARISVSFNFVIG
ncbi:MAG: TIGR02466 family protein [Hyphomicrobiales bacterium]